MKFSSSIDILQKDISDLNGNILDTAPIPRVGELIRIYFKKGVGGRAAHFSYDMRVSQVVYQFYESSTTCPIDDEVLVMLVPDRCCSLDEFNKWFKSHRYGKED